MSRASTREPVTPNDIRAIMERLAGHSLHRPRTQAAIESIMIKERAAFAADSAAEARAATAAAELAAATAAASRAATAAATAAAAKADALRREADRVAQAAAAAAEAVAARANTRRRRNNGIANTLAAITAIKKPQRRVTRNRSPPKPVAAPVRLASAAAPPSAAVNAHVPTAIPPKYRRRSNSIPPLLHGVASATVANSIRRGTYRRSSRSPNHHRYASAAAAAAPTVTVRPLPSTGLRVRSFTTRTRRLSPTRGWVNEHIVHHR